MGVNTVADGEPLRSKRGSAEGQILAPSSHTKLFGGVASSSQS